MHREQGRQLFRLRCWALNCRLMEPLASVRERERIDGPARPLGLPFGEHHGKDHPGGAFAFGVRMAVKDYSDPRWQKVRLRIMERDGFMCGGADRRDASCRCTTSPTRRGSVFGRRMMPT